MIFGHKGFKIRDVALLVMLAVILPLSGIASFSTYILLRNEVYRNTDSELEIAATFAQQTLGPDYHDGIHHADSISKTEFDRIVAQHNKLCRQLQLEYIWSLMILDGEIVFTSSTSPDKAVENGKHAAFLETHSAPEYYDVVFETMETQYHDISDKWGNIRAVLIPHYDAHGRKYIVGASKKLTEVQALTPFLIRNTALVALIFLIPGVFLSIYFAQRITKPIRKFAQKTEELGKGNFSVELEKSGITELDVLTQGFNAMKNSFVETLFELEKFQTVVSNSPIMIYRVTADEQMTTEFISENYAQMGYDINQLRNNTIKWADLIPAEDMERVDKIVEEALAAGSDTHTSEIRMKWADGNYHWYQCWNQFVKDPDGNIVSVQGIMTEITELKNTLERDTLQQAQLEESLHKLKAFENIVTNSPIFTFQRKIDEGLTTEHISTNINLTGYSADDFISGRVQWDQVIPSEDYENLERIAFESLDQGKDQYEVEFRMEWKNGEVHWCKSWNNVLKDSKGNPTHIQGIVSDITDLKDAQERDRIYQQKLENAIHELQAFYQVISSSRIFVYRVRADGHLTTEFLSDNYEMIGYDIDKLRSGEIKWSAIVPEEDIQNISTIVEQTLAEGKEAYSSDSRMRWANGEMHWYKTWNHFIHNSDESISIQGIMMDITDLKEAHERDIKYQHRLRALTQDLLKAEDKERRQLAIALHDDIGQMLAALNMKLSAIDEAEDLEYAKSLRVQIHELLSRIMLTTKSLTWEISPTSLYETDIAAGLERMAGEIKELFGLETTIESAGQRIVLDRNTSAIIFRCAKELLVNVAKHSGVDAAEIGISHYGGKAHFVISDKGCGFDLSIIEKDNRKGYGLFSIQERIEHLGGSTRIESSPETGTKVMIIIPVDIAETLGE